MCLLISPHPHTCMHVQETLPCAEYYKRNGFPIKKIVKFCNNRDYTDVLIFNEDRKQVHAETLSPEP